MTCDICGAYLRPVPSSDDVFDLIGDCVECACQKFVCFFVCYRAEGDDDDLWLEPLVVRWVFTNGLTFRTTSLAPARASYADQKVAVLVTRLDPSDVTRASISEPYRPVPFSYDELCGYVVAGKNVKAYLVMA